MRHGMSHLCFIALTKPFYTKQLQKNNALHGMKGVNSFLAVAITAQFSTDITEKVHMAAHLAIKTLKA
jgi:hypothetical protein